MGNRRCVFIFLRYIVWAWMFVWVVSFVVVVGYILGNELTAIMLKISLSTFYRDLHSTRKHETKLSILLKKHETLCDGSPKIEKRHLIFYDLINV